MKNRNSSQQRPPESLPPSSPTPDGQQLDAASSAAAELTPELERLATAADQGAAAPAVEEAVPGAGESPAKPKIPTADFLAGALAPAFEQLAPNWKVKRHEVVMLAQGWGALLDHYFPGGVEKWGPWAGALGATVAVFGQRVGVPPRLPEPPPSA